MVPFAGYEMPVQYALDHRGAPHGPFGAVGLFDLSHMGEVAVAGAGGGGLPALRGRQRPRRARSRARPSTRCCATTDGGIIDDLIVYRPTSGYLVVCNAANPDAVIAHLADAACARRRLRRRRSRTAATRRAWSPRRARAAAESSSDADRCRPRRARELPRRRSGTVAGIDCLVARTGYTGEDGFELFCDADRTRERLWEALLEAPAPRPGCIRAASGHATRCGSRPACRCTATSSIETTNPFEADLGRVVKLDKGEFVGRDALAAVQQAGPARKLIGLSCATTRSRAPATRCVPDGAAGRARHQRHRSRRRSARRSRWPTVPAERPASATRSRSWCASARYRAEQVKLPFYRRADATDAAHAQGGRTRCMAYPGGPVATPRSTSGSASTGRRATIGITSFAADELGDIVFVELPEVGAALSQFATFGVVESVKAVSDLFAPISGEVAGGQRRAARHARADEHATLRRWLDREGRDVRSGRARRRSSTRTATLPRPPDRAAAMAYSPHTDADRAADARGGRRRPRSRTSSPTSRPRSAPAAWDLPAAARRAGGARASWRAWPAATGSREVSFLGAGAYRHLVPSVVMRGDRPRRSSRPPTRPTSRRCSQGTLQSIYEFQSLICELTGMEVASASTTTAPRPPPRRRSWPAASRAATAIAVSAGVNPEVPRACWRPTARGRGSRSSTCRPTSPRAAAALTEPAKRGARRSDDDVACLVAQQPNFFGAARADVASWPTRRMPRARSSWPWWSRPRWRCSAPPGDYGADLVAAEGQPLGIPASLRRARTSGSWRRSMASVRQMPGRLVGRDSRRGRAARATCSPCRRASSTSAARRRPATSAPTRRSAPWPRPPTSSAVGPTGLREVAELSADPGAPRRRRPSADAGLGERRFAATVLRRGRGPHPGRRAPPRGARPSAGSWPATCWSATTPSWRDTLLLAATELTTDDDVARAGRPRWRRPDERRPSDPPPADASGRGAAFASPRRRRAAEDRRAARSSSASAAGPARRALPARHRRRRARRPPASRQLPASVLRAARPAPAGGRASSTCCATSTGWRTSTTRSTWASTRSGRAR